VSASGSFAVGSGLDVTQRCRSVREPGGFRATRFVAGFITFSSDEVNFESKGFENVDGQLAALQG
jgi:hypothetical protein